MASATLEPSAGPGQGPISVLVLDPSRTRLVLHAGTQEPVAGETWRAGPTVDGTERPLLIATFNGGFKQRDAHGGWLSEGRTVSPVVRGAASVVIYRDGSTDIGTWGTQVPTHGRAVASVRQNLALLVDAGVPQRIHPVGQRQLDQWWGHAFQGEPLISRSALGITASGALVWAAGTKVTVAALASALVAHHVVRALELDVNAPLVRGFLFPGASEVVVHGRQVTAPLPLVLGQTQPVPDPSIRNPRRAQHCAYLTPCSRDFFAVVLR